MERTKIELEDLPELEKEVLGLCVFTESFEKICEECQWTKDEHIVADAIKNLIHKKLLQAQNASISSLSWVYDSDKMKESHFKATSKGLDLIAIF
ncbi:hypothetical protein GYB22_07925 [bacterium]|nr:hypothetical protein [bacterium]